MEKLNLQRGAQRKNKAYRLTCIEISWHSVKMPNSSCLVGQEWDLVFFVSRGLSGSNTGNCIHYLFLQFKLLKFSGVKSTQICSPLVVEIKILKMGLRGVRIKALAKLFLLEDPGKIHSQSLPASEVCSYTLAYGHFQPGSILSSTSIINHPP